MSESDISYPKASGQTITSSDMNKILKVIGTSDADLLAADRLDIHTQKLEMVVQSADPTGGELREGLLWYLTGGVLKYRTATLTRIVANLEEAQTFSGAKTFSGALNVDTITERSSGVGVTIDSVLLKDSFIELSEISAPSTPASDKLRVYAKDSDSNTLLAYKKPDGVEVVLQEGIFDDALRRTVTTAAFEGQLIPCWGVDLNGSATSPVMRGIYVQASTSTTPAQYGGNLFAGSNDVSVQVITSNEDLAAGNIVEVVAFITIPNFAALTTNKLVGFSIQDGYSTPNTDWDKTGVTRKRVMVGADLTGTIFVVTADGTSVTSTSTGITATAGALHKIHIKFIKGTNTVVRINDGAATTVTATLPGRLSMWFAGSGTFSSSQSGPAFLSGYVRFKPS